MKFTTIATILISLVTPIFASGLSHDTTLVSRVYSDQVVDARDFEVVPRTTFLDESAFTRELYERAYEALAAELAQRAYYDDTLLERNFLSLPSREDEDMEDYFSRDYQIQILASRGAARIIGKIASKAAPKALKKLAGKFLGGSSNKDGAPKSTGGKILEAAKDTKTAIGLITDGVGLATDIATGDVPKAVFDGIKLTVDGIIAAFHAISDAIAADKYARSGFTQDTVGKLRKAHPNMNFVICHTAHHYKFPGSKGKQWYHEHRELNVKFPVGSTIGFEIYGFVEGEFFREGDGGYLNWAYIGNVLKTEDGGKHITFKKP